MMIRVERTKGQAGRLGGGQHVERHRKVICKRAGLGEGAEKSLERKRQHRGGGGWLSNHSSSLSRGSTAHNILVSVVSLVRIDGP